MFKLLVLYDRVFFNESIIFLKRSKKSTYRKEGLKMEQQQSPWIDRIGVGRAFVEITGAMFFHAPVSNFASVHRNTYTDNLFSSRDTKLRFIAPRKN